MPTEGVFVPQGSLSITETISTELPSFIPHYDIIYWGILDLFQRSTSLSPAVQSYLDKLKSSANNDDKAIASEISFWHNQLDYAKECVKDITDNAQCARMQLLLNDTRKALKDADAEPYQKNDDYKFVLTDFNLQAYAGPTSDSNKIKTVLAEAEVIMKDLTNTGKCSWRFHLIHASLLSRISLDKTASIKQIKAAQTKLGGDANSHYAFNALAGGIYLNLRDFGNALTHLKLGCDIMKNDGYCRAKLIYLYLYQKKYAEAKEIWNKCKTDLKNGGIADDVLNAMTYYINMDADIDDEKNNASILEWKGSDEATYIGYSLKCYIMAFKTDQFKDDRFSITETDEFKKTSEWLMKTETLGQNATHYQRMVCSFLKFPVDMFTNDTIEDWEMQGATLDNTFSSFSRPLFDDILDALFLENYLFGLFKLRWKADCSKTFRMSIICNCRGNMNSYVGEVVGIQNAGMSDLAVQKIEEIQQLGVSVDALTLFPIDAKRMKGGDDAKVAENELIELIKQQNDNYDAYLALADIYLSQSKYQAALLLMQQVIEKETALCSANLEVTMKWGTILFFNNYYPAALQIFRDYVMKNLTAASHGYYLGIAAVLFLELGKFKEIWELERTDRLGGRDFYMLRFNCYRFWIRLSRKYKPEQKQKKNRPKPKKKPGKQQYGKAVDMATKMTKTAPDHPLGYSLLARSMAGMGSVYKAEKIEQNIAKAVECAEALLSTKDILPKLYYESMINCGVAAYMIDKDGSEYYNKATTNAPHGESVLMKLQKDQITKQGINEAEIRTILTDIRKKSLKFGAYTRNVPVFKYTLDDAIAKSKDWNIFGPNPVLPDTGELGMDITKPNARPSTDDKPKAKGKGKAKAKAKAKDKAKPVPDTDDNKSSTVSPADAKEEKATGSGSGGGDFDSKGVESPFRYVNFVSNSYPSQRLTYSLPFDEGYEMGQLLTQLLRNTWKDLSAPTDDADLIGRIQWGGEKALEFVIEACKDKTDPLHLGLANFAYTYKVDLGIASEDHLKCFEAMKEKTKELSYEGKIGFAAVTGLQCRDFEADEMYKEYSTLKDADKSDWLYWRTFGHYLLYVKHKYNDAVSALSNAYAAKKKDPMTIGWYISALYKSNKAENIKKIETIFDDIGKLHETNTDIAVIRSEFLNSFNIQNPADYAKLIKNDTETDLCKVRKLLSYSRYDRKYIIDNGGMKKLIKAIKPKGNMMYKILILYFSAYTNWSYNNCLKECCDAMNNAGMACMDYTLANVFQSYCFAKKNEWDTAQETFNQIPTKTFDPQLIQCSAMISDDLADDVKTSKEMSSGMFISRINNLRFIKKKPEDAIKELTSEFLVKYRNDFNALVALSDIYLSLGAIQSAYNIYYALYITYPIKYKTNFLLRLKFAECMRLNGFVNESLNEFKTVLSYFDFAERIKSMEFGAYTDLILGFILLLITIGDYTSAEEYLKYCTKSHILYKIADSHLSLIKNATAADPAICKGVFDKYNDPDNPGDNIFLISHIIRAGKSCDPPEDTTAAEAKLTELLKKYSSINSVVQYCKQDIKASNLQDIPPDIQPFLINNIDDISSLATNANNEIEAIKSGKIGKTTKKGGSGGGGNKKTTKNIKKKGAKKDNKSAGSAGPAGPKPVVNYSATPFKERKKWSFELTSSLPQPTETEVVNWSPSDIGNFISCIPIFGLNIWYGKKFKEMGVNGKMFLNCNEKNLIKWGVDKKCHRARFRAEALSMKRRG